MVTNEWATVSQLIVSHFWTQIDIHFFRWLHKRRRNPKMNEIKLLINLLDCWLLMIKKIWLFLLAVVCSYCCALLLCVLSYYICCVYWLAFCYWYARSLCECFNKINPFITDILSFGIYDSCVVQYHYYWNTEIPILSTKHTHTLKLNLFPIINGGKTDYGNFFSSSSSL